MVPATIPRRTPNVAALARAAALSLFVAFGFAGNAAAGSYDPVLVLGEAVSTGSGQPTLLTMTGNWSFDDVLQVDFPIVVVVFQGATFVRYPFGGATAVSGTFAGLTDGLLVSEIQNFETTGSAEPRASIVRLTAHEMTLSLPPLFTAAPVHVVLYVHLAREGILMSNAIDSRSEVLP